MSHVGLHSEAALGLHEGLQQRFELGSTRCPTTNSDGRSDSEPESPTYYSASLPTSSSLLCRFPTPHSPSANPRFSPVLNPLIECKDVGGGTGAAGTAALVLSRLQ